MKPYEDNPLSHLTESEVESLIAGYYAGVKVKALIEKYRLAVKPTKLVSIFPDEILNELCIHCKEPLRLKRLSKTSGKYVSDIKKVPFCKECGHLEFSLVERSGRCECGNCQKQLQEVAFTYIVDFNTQLPSIQSLDDLSARDLIYLAVLTDNPLPVESSFKVGSLDFLSAFDAQAEVILNRLLGRGIVKISEDCPYTSLKMDNDGKVEGIHQHRVLLRLNVDSRRCETLSDLSALCVQRVKENFDASLIYDVYREWAFSELFGCYLEREDMFYSLPKGKVTKGAFGYLIDNFSIGEGIYILSRVMKSAYEYGRRKDIGLKRGANVIPGNIQKYGTSILNDNGSVPAYSLKQESNNSFRRVMTNILSLSSPSIQQRISERVLDCYGETGDYGNPIQESVKERGGVVPPVSSGWIASEETFAESRRISPKLMERSQGSPPIDLGNLQAAMDDRRWPIEYVAEETGTDLERLFSIVRGQVEPTQLESATLVLFFHECD